MQIHSTKTPFRAASTNMRLAAGTILAAAVLGGTASPARAADAVVLKPRLSARTELYVEVVTDLAAHRFHR